MQLCTDQLFTGREKRALVDYFARLVIGCIDDDCASKFSFAGLFDIYKMCALLHCSNPKMFAEVTIVLVSFCHDINTMLVDICQT